MGWLWSSNSSPASSSETKDGEEAAPSKKSSFALTEEQKARMLSRAGFTPQPKNEPSASSSSKSREEAADAELDAFLKSFSAPDAETAPVPELAEYAQAQQPRQPQDHDRYLPDGSLNIHPAALYPQTMSCRSAFDQAFYCQSFGGKFNDLYRFGHLKDCSEQWGAFWFCMRTRTLGDEQKHAQVRKYYQDREERKKKEFGSSEDIWDLRLKAVDKAFHKNPDDEEDVQKTLQKP